MSVKVQGKAGKPSKKTLEMVELSLFGALIVILAFTPMIGYIPLGITKATIIHIPVILGSLLLGPKRGAVLGGIFGLTSLISNTISPTVASFTFSPFYTAGGVHGGFRSLIVCFLPRILVGVVPWLVYRLVKKAVGNKRGGGTASLALAGILGSLTNTLLVMNLIYFLFRADYAEVKGVAAEALYGVILSIIAVNGIPEMLLAGLLTAVIGKALFKALKKTPDVLPHPAP